MPNRNIFFTFATPKLLKPVKPLKLVKLLKPLKPVKHRILTLLFLLISLPLLADTSKCPLPPQNVKAVLSEDGNKVTVSWDAVTQTEDGSEIDKSKLTYYIFDAYGKISDPALASTKECSYTFNYTNIKEQDFKAYEITAGVGEMYSESFVAYSNIVIVGPAYKLPWSESFPEGTAQQTLWGVTPETTKTCFYKIMKDGDWGDMITSQDADNGFFLMMPTADGDRFGMFSGKIDISKAEHPALEFYYQGHSGTIEAYPFTKIDLSKNTADGWQLCKINLESYKDQGIIQFALNFISDNASSETKAVAIDNIRVFDDDGSPALDYGSDKYPTPTGLTATVSTSVPDSPATVPGESSPGSTTDIRLTWDAIDMNILTSITYRSENFENPDYPSFAINNFGGWTLYDGDKATEYKIVSIPNNPYTGSTKSWQLTQFERSGLPENYRPDFVGPDNSPSILISYSAADAKTDNWLISPLLTGEEQTISFFIKAFSIAYGKETFEVLYSKDGKDVKDFVKLADPNNYDTNGVGEDWTECHFTLPEGARYFAIRHTTRNNWALMLDNISFIQASILPADCQLLGYNILRDGKKLNDEPITDNSYTDTNLAAGSYDYQVAAIYSVGQSRYSKVVVANVNNSTAIRNITIPETFETIETIYNLKGQRVLSHPRSEDRGGADRGIYIINGKKILKK